MAEGGRTLTVVTMIRGKDRGKVCVVVQLLSRSRTRRLVPRGQRPPHPATPRREMFMRDGRVCVVQTIGELWNSLGIFAGSMVEKMSISPDGAAITNPDQTLEACGIASTATFTVTFARSPRLQASQGSDRGEETIVGIDPTTQQRVFRTLEVRFAAAPFGLELEVGSHARRIVRTSGCHAAARHACPRRD
jgi:hypothetical protein